MIALRLRETWAKFVYLLTPDMVKKGKTVVQRAERASLEADILMRQWRMEKKPK